MNRIRFLRLVSLVLLGMAGDSLFAVPPATGDPYPLTFANDPVVGAAATDRDLGDALPGVAVERRISAYGGTPPYTYSTDDTTKTAMLGVGLELLPNGIVTFNGQNAPVGVFSFPVTVKDSFGFSPHSVTETFGINFVNTTTYRFAHDKLSTGAVGSPYGAHLAAINGTSPIIFGTANVTLNGNPVTKLDTTGLSMSASGILHGVPIVAGTLAFDGFATATGGALAADRTGAGNSQRFTVELLPNTVVSSNFTPNSITLKTGNLADKKGVGRDSIALKGFVNLDGRAVRFLSGFPFTLRVGRYTSPPVIFNDRGIATSAKGVTPTISVKLTDKGLFTVSIAKEKIASLGFTGLQGDLGVEVRAGGALLGSSLQTFSIKPKGTSAVITSMYGRPLSSNHGGTGHLLNVAGADNKAGTGDSWKVIFLGALPNDLTASLNDAVTARIKIGSTYENVITLTNKNGKLSAKGDNKTAVVASFLFDTKLGKGSLTTGPLLPADTGIPLAGATTTQGHFPMEIIFRKANGDAIYGIQGAAAIVGTGKGKWTSAIQ